MSTEVSADPLFAAIDALRKEAGELLETAWGIIANANEGNWSTARPEWREAAVRWRDAYHASQLRESYRLLAAEYERMPGTTDTSGGAPTDAVPEVSPG